jgi:hypothetical protein
MPDMEKVTQCLETCVSGCKEGCPYEYKNFIYRVGCKVDLMRDALALLKEQEAIEPKKENDGNPEPCTSWWYVCGDCGRYIDPHDRFCRHCGREVDWLKEEQHGQD